MFDLLHFSLFLRSAAAGLPSRLLASSFDPSLLGMDPFGSGRFPPSVQRGGGGVVGAARCPRDDSHVPKMNPSQQRRSVRGHLRRLQFSFPLHERSSFLQTPLSNISFENEVTLYKLGTIWHLPQGQRERERGPNERQRVKTEKCCS